MDIPSSTVSQNKQDFDKTSTFSPDESGLSFSELERSVDTRNKTADLQSSDAILPT